MRISMSSGARVLRAHSRSMNDSVSFDMDDERVTAVGVENDVRELVLLTSGDSVSALCVCEDGNVMLATDA